MILGLAITAFAVDRLFLGGGFGPQSAAAEVPDADTATIAPAEPTPAQPVHGLSGVADRFEGFRGEALASVEGVRDVFDATSFVEEQVPISQPAIEAQTLQDRAIAAFTSANRLTAASDRVVIINNERSWRIGDTDEAGFELVRIDVAKLRTAPDAGPTKAVFRYKDREVELPLR